MHPAYEPAAPPRHATSARSCRACIWAGLLALSLAGAVAAQSPAIEPPPAPVSADQNGSGEAAPPSVDPQEPAPETTPPVQRRPAGLRQRRLGWAPSARIERRRDWRVLAPIAFVFSIVAGLMMPYLRSRRTAQIQFEEEEEARTAPSASAQTDDGVPMEDYEYKILRVPIGTWWNVPRFANPDERAIALQNEARYGWTLFEVFDGWRIRLRRPVSARAMDARLGGDPYSTKAVFKPGA